MNAQCSKISEVIFCIVIIRFQRMGCIKSERRILCIISNCSNMQKRNKMKAFKNSIFLHKETLGHNIPAATPQALIGSNDHRLPTGWCCHSILLILPSHHSINALQWLASCVEDMNCSEMSYAPHEVKANCANDRFLLTRTVLQ